MREKIDLEWPEDLDDQQKHCAALQSEIAVASDRKDKLLKVCVLVIQTHSCSFCILSENWTPKNYL